MKTVLVEGSSTAYGAGAGSYGGWAAALHRDSLALNDRDRLNPQVVTNLSMPGLTLIAVNKIFNGMRERFRYVPDHSLVRILAVGQIESTIPPERTRPIITLGRFARELVVYSEESHAAGAQTLYVGPQMADESVEMPGRWTIENDLTEEYAGLVRFTAQDTGSTYIDVARLFADNAPEGELLADGRHPNARGHQLIYSAVALELEALGFLRPE